MATILENFYKQPDDSFEEPVKTVDLTNESKTTGSTRSYTEPSTNVSTTKGGITETKTEYGIGTKNNLSTQKYEQNKDYKILTQPEFEAKYKPASASVMAKLGMEKPTPPDNERLKKIMGAQAIGEALRNVVDAVQGKRKAIIGKHKSYTNEFANQIANEDKNFSNQLKEYYKTLNDAQKQASDDYMKYLLMETARASSKVTTDKGDYKPPTATTTTITPEKKVTTEIGGKYTESKTETEKRGTTQQQERPDYSFGAGTDTEKLGNVIKFENGVTVKLKGTTETDAVLNGVLGLRGEDSLYNPRVVALSKKADKGEPLTESEKREIIIAIGNKFPDKITKVAKAINAEIVMGESGNTLTNIGTKEAVEAKKRQSAKSKPVKQYKQQQQQQVKPKVKPKAKDYNI